MTLNAILHYSAACFCAGVVCFVLLREKRSYVHWLFGLGMFILAGEAFFTGLSIQTLDAEQAIAWQHLRLLAAVEALTGLVLIAWTASFAFLLMQRLWHDRALHTDEPHTKEPHTE